MIYLTNLVETTSSVTDNLQQAIENILTTSPSELVKNFFTTSFFKFLGDLFLCILILYFGFFIIKRISPYIKKVISKTVNDLTVEKFIFNLINYTLKLFVVLVAVAKIGIETTSIVALLGALGFAVGLAFQGALSHFAGGILILTQRPFSVGDYVKIADEEGNVHAISLLGTTLYTLDNKVVHIPNGNITTGHIVNYTKLDTRRVDIAVTAAYRENSTRIIAVLKDVCEKNQYVLDTPKTEVVLSGMLDSSVEYTLKAWVNTKDYWTAHFELMESVKHKFDELGIEIPFNQLDVNIVK